MVKTVIGRNWKRQSISTHSSGGLPWYMDRTPKVINLLFFAWLVLCLQGANSWNTMLKCILENNSNILTFIISKQEVFVFQFQYLNRVQLDTCILMIPFFTAQRTVCSFGPVITVRCFRTMSHFIWTSKLCARITWVTSNISTFPSHWL